MTRTPKTSPGKENLLVPYIPSQSQNEDDCFGHLYDPTHAKCSVCAALDLCGILYQANTIEPKKTRFEEANLTLDRADFKSVNLNDIEKVAKRYEADGEPLSLEELVNFIKEKAKINDNETIQEYLKMNLPLTNMRINLEEGTIYVEGSLNS